MSDHPPENPGSSLPPFAGAPTEAPSRSLSEILEELALITNAHQGDASAMRSAVSELSRALARLFEMIRADRADQASRIAELEHALQVANSRIAELEAEEVAEPGAAPHASDFDALRGAAERLRARTAEIVREAGTPADQAAREQETDLIAQAARDEADRIEAAHQAIEASLAEEASADAEDAEVVSAAPAGTHELPRTPVRDEPFGQPGVLRVFPGAVLRKDLAEDLDIESELVFDEEPRRIAAVAPIPTAPVQAAPDEAGEAVPDEAVEETAAVEPEPEPDVKVAEAAAKMEAPEPVVDVEPEPDHPAPSAKPRPEPVAIEPRAARRRRGFRRRRIDARKLKGVDPPAALRAMVSSVDDLWTAGNPLDLVVALTDGGTLHITGGDRVPLRVEEVEAGTSGRSTVTATSDQIVPLFGRLELTGEQSAPHVHGSRRDADLLVGWIDRAQRLEAQPL